MEKVSPQEYPTDKERVFEGFHKTPPIGMALPNLGATPSHLKRAKMLANNLKAASME